MWFLSSTTSAFSLHFLSLFPFLSFPSFLDSIREFWAYDLVPGALFLLSCVIPLMIHNFYFRSFGVDESIVPILPDIHVFLYL